MYSSYKVDKNDVGLAVADAKTNRIGAFGIKLDGYGGRADAALLCRAERH